MSENQLPFERIKREILVRKNSKTNIKYGTNPEERTVEQLLQYGIININKPKGPTSHQVSAYVKDILGIKKSGHSGTLDPNVTGVLPIAFNKATRIVQTLLPSGKEYICIMHLHDEFSDEKIKDVMNSFVGKIKQLPPIKSAIKRVFRYRKIYYIDIIEIEDQDVLFRVGCQAGTYIRKLCHDIGQKLDSGAHMAELIRTKAGPFNEKGMITLEDLRDSYYYYKEENQEKYLREVVKPIEFAVSHLPKVWILDSTVKPLCHGTDLYVRGISKVESEIQVDEMVAVMSLKDELVCLGNIKMTSREMLSEEKGVAVKVEKVFMEPGIYQ